MNGEVALASGGNINLAGYPSPLRIPTGGSVVLRLYDFVDTWRVESVQPAVPPQSGTCVPEGYTTAVIDGGKRRLAICR